MALAAWTIWKKQVEESFVRSLIFNIQHLLLDWGEEREGKEYNDEDVMTGLKTNATLKKWTIEYFMGKKFASWITMMTNLVEITLRYC